MNEYPRLVQITVSNGTIYALDNDGDVWTLRMGDDEWDHVGSPRQKEEDRQTLRDDEIRKELKSLKLRGTAVYPKDGDV